MAYDSKCYDLAAAFLEGYTLSNLARAEETDRLAQTIQDAIEAELESLNDLRETPLDLRAVGDADVYRQPGRQHGGRVVPRKTR